MNKHNLFIIAFILNILILPGFGNVLSGYFKDGFLQMLVAIVGGAIALLFLPQLGLPILVVALVWSIYTGVHILQESYTESLQKKVKVY